MAVSDEGRDSGIPILRPKMGKKARPDRVPRFSRSVIARIAKMGGVRKEKKAASPRGGHHHRGAKPAHVRQPDGLSRRVIVKAHVHRMGASRDLKAAVDHVRYVERDGVEKDGGKGIVYSASGECAPDAFIQRMQGDPHQFRFIVSPEDAGELDLTEFTKGLLARMESDLGRKLDWVASNHFNTDNPHAHVVVRGRDHDGKTLFISPEYIAKSLRWRAQELATLELGPRTELEVQRGLVREMNRERYTSLDRALAGIAKDGKFDLTELPESGRITRRHLLGRLQMLEELALVHRPQSQLRGTLVPGWEERLRAMGERGDVIKRMHAALKGDLSKYRVLGPEATAEAGPIEGVVREKGPHRELDGSLYAVVETATGAGYYVPLDAQGAEGLRKGDLVTIDVREDGWVKKADREIAAVAARAEGIYSVDQHVRELGEGARPLAGGGSAAPSAFAAAHAKRLERLERFGLVKALGGGRWRVPATLLSDLAQRDRSHPRRRIAVRKQPMRLLEQRTHRGPVWLDRSGSATTPAPYGFGAEVARARQERDVFLRSVGIDPTAPDRLAAVRALERRELGQRLARSSRATFVAGVPKGDTFKGTVRALPALPSGQRYAQVLDQVRDRFLLLPLTNDLKPFEGRVAEIARDQNGKLVVRTPGMSKGA